MSGNDCWNRVSFSCIWKVDSDVADVTLSGSLFQSLFDRNWFFFCFFRGGLKGNVRTSSIARWKACGRLTQTLLRRLNACSVKWWLRHLSATQSVIMALIEVTGNNQFVEQYTISIRASLNCHCQMLRQLNIMAPSLAKSQQICHLTHVKK